MSFDPDISKQAQKVTLPRKSHKFTHPPVSLNNSHVVCKSSQKHLSVYLDDKLNLTMSYPELSEHTCTYIYI